MQARRRYHVALISNPSVCSGAAASLSRRVAFKPKTTPEAAGMPDLSFGLKAMRSESAAAAPEHTLGVEVRATW